MKEKNRRIVVRDCTFTGIHWDEESIKSLEMISQALLNMTEVFRSQNIVINSLLSIDPERKEKV